MSNRPIKMGMAPTPIGQFIREEVFVPLDISVSHAAKLLKVRRATLSDIVNGKARLSPETALRIEKAFGVSMELLLRMQTVQEVATARARAEDLDVERYVPA